MSDGTTNGTVMVNDINTIGSSLTGTQSGFPYELTVIGSQFSFTADDGVNGRELWLGSL
jgi:ELWxxDGT repeat protein